MGVRITVPSRYEWLSNLSPSVRARLFDFLFAKISREELIRILGIDFVSSFPKQCPSDSDSNLKNNENILNFTEEGSPGIEDIKL